MEKSLITSCNRNVSRTLRVQLITSVAAIALSAGSAIAQDNSGASDNSETIVVTGSRISTPGFESPTPVVALGTQSLERLADTNVSNLEYAIPQLAPFGSVIGTQYALNLRNLGATRTLVLLDGMRVMPDNPSNNTIDADLLPALMISNVSIVTGGASAAYGSDAVAGVVNLTLDNKFDGFKATVQAGETEYSDYKNLDVATAFGTSFGPGDKGHVVISGDYYVNDGTKSELTRPWDKANWALCANPSPTALPHNYFCSNVTLSTENPAGVIDNGPLKGTTFAPDGTPIYNSFYGTQVGSLFMVGGDGGSYSPQAQLTPIEGHMTAYSRGSYDFDKHLNVFAEVMVGRGTYDYGLIPNFFPGNITVSINNAFLPGAIKSTMQADNITTFALGRMNSDFGPEAGFDMFKPVYNNYHTAVGGSGLIAGSWTWKAFAQFNSTTYMYRYYDDMNDANFSNAVNSQINPATGNPICASTLTNPTNGCVPIDLFGYGAPSIAAINYVTATDIMYLTETEVDTALDLQGQPFDTWAGPVSVATGFEWRREGEGGKSDPINAALGYYNDQPVIHGGYSVEEGYLEAVVPLAKDMPFAKLLNVDLGGRLTNYSTSGLTETWKVGLNYTPIDELRLRGTFSHDIRAPLLAELFKPISYGLQTVLDPTTGQQNSAQPVTGGNATLLPEQANDITAGVVYQPDWVPGLQMSVDYFRDSIHDAISTLSAQQVVNDCYDLHQAQSCAEITRSASTGLIQFISTTFLNLNRLETQGFDLESSYGFTGSDLYSAIPGNFNIHMTGTFVGSLLTVTQGVNLQYAGMTGVNGTANPGEPHWRLNFDVVWDWAPFTTQAYIRYVGDGLFNSQYVPGVDISAAESQLPSVTYLDLSETYQFNSEIQLFAKIANVLDTAPPLNPTNILRPLASGSPYFDVLGRDFSVAVRIKT